MCSLMEMITHDYMVKIFEDLDMIIALQHCFYSGLTGLLLLYFDVYDESKSISGYHLTGIPKAVHKVPYKRLFNKLLTHGIFELYSQITSGLSL